MNEDDDISALFQNEPSNSARGEAESRVGRTLHRVNASVGQKQTLGFVLVNIWVTIAKVLAPLFAMLAKRHAHTLRNQQNINTFTGEKDGGS